MMAVEISRQPGPRWQRLVAALLVTGVGAAVVAGCSVADRGEAAEIGSGDTDMVCSIAVPGATLGSLEQLDLLWAQPRPIDEDYRDSFPDVDIALGHRDSGATSSSRCVSSSDEAELDLPISEARWQQVEPLPGDQRPEFMFCIDGRASTCVQGDDRAEVEGIVAESLLLSRDQWERLTEVWRDRYFGSDPSAEFPWLAGGYFEAVAFDGYRIFGRSDERCFGPQLRVDLEAGGWVRQAGWCAPDLNAAPEDRETDPTVIMIGASEIGDEFALLLGKVQ